MKTEHHFMQLVADKKTLEKSTNGSITSVIYFDFGKIKFPEKEWSDMTLIILGWWLKNAQRLITEKSRTEEFMFMDGPFFLRATIKDRESWLLECIDNTNNSFVEYSQTVSKYEFITTLFKVVGNMLTACESRGWTSPDIDNINKLIRIEKLDRLKIGPSQIFKNELTLHLGTQH